MSETGERNRVEELVTRHARRSFGPGFADRVMDRVGDESRGFEGLLLMQFRRVALVGALAAVLVATANLIGGLSRSDQTIVEALLGLEPVTVDSIYSVESVLDPLGESAL